MQHRDEQDQGEDRDRPDAADRNELVLDRFHVEDPECRDEKGQVAEQEDQPGRAAAPPGIVPGERPGPIEQVFHHHTEGRSNDSDECPVRDAQMRVFLSGSSIWSR